VVVRLLIAVWVILFWLFGGTLYVWALIALFLFICVDVLMYSICWLFIGNVVFIGD